MKNVLFILIFLLLISCVTSKKVYWCGDHACINKQEKEEYFKKTMIVEIREFNKKKEKTSKIDKITNYQDKNDKKKIRADQKQRLKDEKELAKQMRIEEKQRLKNQKQLAKQLRLEQKKRLKDEKELAKQMRLEEKQRLKNQKVSAKKKSKEAKELVKIKKTPLKNSIVKIDKNIFSSDFDILVKQINEKNKLKPYPDINHTPN